DRESRRAPQLLKTPAAFLPGRGVQHLDHLIGIQFRSRLDLGPENQPLRISLNGDWNRPQPNGLVRAQCQDQRAVFAENLVVNIVAERWSQGPAPDWLPQLGPTVADGQDELIVRSPEGRANRFTGPAERRAERPCGGRPPPPRLTLEVKATRRQNCFAIVAEA